MDIGMPGVFFLHIGCKDHVSVRTTFNKKSWHCWSIIFPLVLGYPWAEVLINTPRRFSIWNTSLLKKLSAFFLWRKFSQPAETLRKSQTKHDHQVTTENRPQRGPSVVLVGEDCAFPWRLDRIRSWSEGWSRLWSVLERRMAQSIGLHWFTECDTFTRTQSWNFNMWLDPLSDASDRLRFQYFLDPHGKPQYIRAVQGHGGTPSSDPQFFTLLKNPVWLKKSTRLPCRIFYTPIVEGRLIAGDTSDLRGTQTWFFSAMGHWRSHCPMLENSERKNLEWWAHCKHSTRPDLDAVSVHSWLGDRTGPRIDFFHESVSLRIFWKTPCHQKHW